MSRGVDVGQVNIGEVVLDVGRRFKDRGLRVIFIGVSSRVLPGQEVERAVEEGLEAIYSSGNSELE